MFDSNNSLDEFEKAWNNAPPRPNYTSYLAPFGTPRANKHVTQLVCVDIEHRLRNGDEAPLVKQYAWSLETNDDRLAVIRHEYQQRWRRGERVSTKEYERLFPELAQPLEQLRPQYDCPACGTENITLTDPFSTFAVCSHCEVRADVAGLFSCHGSGAPDHLQLLLEVGRGSCGIVYKALDTDLGRHVAVKALRKEHLSDDSLVEMFWSECRILASLQHRGVPTVHMHGKLSDGRPYFAMQLVEGESFANTIRRTPTSSEGTRTLIRLWLDACRIVEYAHGMGVVHGDLSPDNILISDAREVFVTDWGARSYGRNGDQERILTTPPYAAPELFENGTLGEETDVFAIGAMLYEVLMQKPTYDRKARPTADDLPDAKRKLDEAAARDGTGFDQPLADIIKRMIHNSPEARPRLSAVISEVTDWCDTRDRRSLETQFLAKDAEARQEQLAQRLASERALRKKTEEVAVESARAQRNARLLGLSTGLLMIAASCFALFGWRTAESFRRAEDRERTLRSMAADAGQMHNLRTQQITEVAGLLSDVLLSQDPLGFDAPGFRSIAEVGHPLDKDQLLKRVARRVRSTFNDGTPIDATLLDAIGNPLRAAGDHETALPLLERALEIREQSVPRDRHALATSHFHLAMLHHDARRFAIAKTYYEAAMSISPSDQQVSDVKLRYAWMLGEAKHYDDAAALVDEVIRSRITHHGEQSPEVEVARIAKFFVSLDHKDKTAAVQEAASLLKGNAFLAKAMGLYGVASMQRAARNYPIATDQYEELLELTRQHVGPRHPLLGLLLGDMAGLYREVGNEQRSEECIKEALAIGRKTIPTHDFMIHALLEYGRSLEDRSRFAEAERLYHEAYEYATNREAFGVKDRRKVDAIDHLINLTERTGDATKLKRYKEMAEVVDE